MAYGVSRNAVTEKGLSRVKEDPLDMAMLFDFYGDVLTDKQRDFFDLYYNRDLSLGEIAEDTGITRQGVRDVIVRATQTLKGMENKLGLVARHDAEQTGLNEISEAAAAIERINGQRFFNATIRDNALLIQKIAYEILNK